MSALLGAQFLEQNEIDDLRQQFPRFCGEVPKEARFWTRTDLEEFFRSEGRKRPDEVCSSAIQSCPLLSRLRLQLAESKVKKAIPEYASYCKHLRQQSHFCQLPAAGSSSVVQRVREAPAQLTEPVTIVPRRDRVVKAEEWTLEFWRLNCNDVRWKCQSRPPAFEHDAADAFMLEATIGEYVEYMEVISNMDGECSEDKSLAYPRVHIDGWCPFATFAFELFEGAWKELNPPGVRDLTPRWCEMYAATLDLGDWKQFLAQFYRIDIGVVGSFTRLHCEKHGAHQWFTQIGGQRLFFLFPPQDATKLYEEKGGYVEIVEEMFMDYTTMTSPVDPFSPSQKKHPRFSLTTVKAALLGEGKTLVVPAGWWWCSVVTEPSVTLRHIFWDMDNRSRIVEEWWAPIERRSGDEREQLRPLFTELREELLQDDGTSSDKYVVIEGG
mmetsp:Transcript_47101/g.108863  ORF Transcript_47101/g.108863 Transcript_47101/m.108863 type:complete len:439 (+) Transcript_47101:88-1404(+)